MIEQLKELLSYSNNCIAFTGAGISTLSGIPDFRGKDGVFSKQWKGMDVEKIHDIDFFQKHPEIFYEYARDFIYNLETRQPNIVHLTLAKMQQLKMISKIYTQNIDGLHQRAGSCQVSEFHGSAASHHCMKCQAIYPTPQIAQIVKTGQVPYCPQCGGLIKPDVIFFGESMDMELLDKAFADLQHADLLLVLGTSLNVPPAASLPMATYYSGGKIVIVNKQPTPLDKYAIRKFDDLNEVFTELENWLKKDYEQNKQ